MFYYSIYDKVSEDFCPLFYSKNDKVAVRAFARFLDVQKQNEDEFELYCVCKVDFDTSKKSVKVSKEMRLIDLGLLNVEEKTEEI